MSAVFVLDNSGQRVYEGDYVKCGVDFYSSIKRGDQRRVQRIEDECIVLNNGSSPYGTSLYRSCNFNLSGRMAPAHRNKMAHDAMELVNQQENKTMLHIALEIGEAPVGNIVSWFNNGNWPKNSAMSDTSADALKERIRARLSLHPLEKWLIFSANTIGERADPPVRFRSV